MARIHRWLASLPFYLLIVLVVACDRSSEVEIQPETPAESISHADSADENSVNDSVQQVDAPFDRNQAIDEAMTLLESGQTKKAAAKLQEVLLTDPTDAEVLFRMARLHADQGELVQALEFLESIPVDHPEAGLPALGQAADWCMMLQRYDDAEKKYLQVLKLAGDVPVAHRQLAYLYNRQGRRQEAAEHLRALCRTGNVQQDELHALMVLGHAIFDDPNLPPTGPNPKYPIGPAATARMLYTASRFVEAVEVLDPSVRSGNAVPSDEAFYGLLAVEAQDMERFHWWLGQTDESTKAFAEYWAAIGAYLVAEGRFDEAIRALSEAVDRDPTNVGSLRRLFQAFNALGDKAQADRFMKVHATVKEITLASNSLGGSAESDAESYQKIAKGLDELNRPLEAMTWRLFGAFHRKASQDEINALNQKRVALFTSEDAFPDRDERLCGVDLEKYPLPELKIPETLPTNSSQGDVRIAEVPQPKFEDVAVSIGLSHTFQISSMPQWERFALHQSLGGGIAALDFDLDGKVDLYLAQGGNDPPGLSGGVSNQLFRHVDNRLMDVTGMANATDFRYSIGVGSGDWNQDGFADLAVMSIGAKLLMINNGDGTFHVQAFDEDPDNDVLPSSVAIADVTGDGLPDIYALHYVEDPRMSERPGVDENGLILTVAPATYHPGIDSVAINDGKGGMIHQRVSDSSADASTGLGVVVADWDGKPGNEIFVGNDVRSNQLWVRSPSTTQWSDVAAVRGCALGIGGTQTASMGVAVADFDGNGERDIHIANFSQESVSLFMNRGGMFQDLCVQYGLNVDSRSVLGFGCQAFDYNLDGRPDLAVTNGNIEKAPDEPLLQSPQFFVNLGNRFQLSDVDDASGYWQGKYLGRCMARLDFDADGKQDLCISHLGSPSALLLNRTESKNHWLGVRLVGTESERDANGAEVQVRIGDSVLTNWLVGGDGYLCRNEPIVPFGLGTATVIDEVAVTWPSGKKQTFQNIPVDRYVLLIENESEAHRLEVATHLRGSR